MAELLRPFEIIDVSGFAALEAEQLGTKPKRWLRDPQGRAWLFKSMLSDPGRAHRGEDWAEKVAAELAAIAAVPCATVELAVDRGVRGVLSLDVRTDFSGVELVHGNQLLVSHDRSYPRHERRKIDAYRVDKTIESLRRTDPTGLATIQFVTYLGFDALIGNTDRHHENWAVFRSAEGGAHPVLAPSFDHGTSLGCGIDDAERSARLSTSDSGYSVAAYARRARSHFADARTLLDAAIAACRLVPEAIDQVRRIAEPLSDDAAHETLARVPDQRMSGLARRFAAALISANRAQLLDRLEALP